MNEFIEIATTRKRNRLVHGVGINDAWYKTEIKVKGERIGCPYYLKWKAMLHRCYSEKSQQSYPTYKDCYVCEEWLTFSNFRKWMEKQDWIAKELDKDIINPGNKQYSPENCVFVSRKLNTLLLDCAAKRGTYPQGVYFKKQNRRFTAQCRISTKVKKHLGYFDTPEEASAAYKEFKSNLIMQIANEQTDFRIKIGLLKHARIIQGY